MQFTRDGSAIENALDKLSELPIPDELREKFASVLMSPESDSFDKNV